MRMFVTFLNFLRHLRSPHARWDWLFHPLAIELLYRRKDIRWEFFAGDPSRPGKDHPQWWQHWPWVILRPKQSDGSQYSGTYHVFFWSHGPWGTREAVSGDAAVQIGNGDVWFTALTKDGVPLRLIVVATDVAKAEIPEGVTKL